MSESEATALIRRAEAREEWMQILESQGRRVADEKPRLSRFALMLSHPEFAEFFDSNFGSWEDCKQSIMLLKVGAHLRDAMVRSNGEDVSGNQLAAAIDQFLHDPSSRQFMVQQMNKFMHENGGGDASSFKAITPPTPRADDALLKVLGTQE